MLLDRRRGSLALQLLNIRRDVHRHLAQFANASILAPPEEGPGRAAVRGPRVGVADIDSEEFEKAEGGPFSSPSNQRRESRAALNHRNSSVHGRRPLA